MKRHAEFFDKRAKQGLSYKRNKIKDGHVFQYADGRMAWFDKKENKYHYVHEDGDEVDDTAPRVEFYAGVALEEQLRMIQEPRDAEDNRFRTYMRRVRRFILQRELGCAQFDDLVPTAENLKFVESLLEEEPKIWAERMWAEFKKIYLDQEALELEKQNPELVRRRFLERTNDGIHLDEIIPLSAGDFRIKEHLKIFSGRNSHLLPAVVNMAKRAHYYERDFIALVHGESVDKWAPPNPLTLQPATIDGARFERGSHFKPMAQLRRAYLNPRLPFDIPFNVTQWCTNLLGRTE